MPLNLMILTSYFAIEPNNIRGGIGYRYVGLYGSLVKALLKKSPESKVFWYSHSDQTVRTFSSKEEIVKHQTGMLKSLLHIVLSTLKSGKRLVIIVAYPYAVKFNTVLSYIFSLLICKSFSAHGRIRIIVDDFDPPVEAAYAFSEAKPSILSVIYGRTLECLTLTLSSVVITVSESFKQHISRTYRIKKDKIFVVPNGCLVKFIKHVPPKQKGSFIILYSGSIMRSKSIDKLLSTVKTLKERGLKLSLVLTGALVDVPLPEYVIHKQVEDWMLYVKSCLEKCDVCVIPYPNKPFWSLTLLAKLFDYMAAGKPIVTTNLKETGNIIKMFNCGLVAKDWNQFYSHLERLYYDRELARRLGNNGRVVAERYFNYELLAKKLLSKLIEMFMAECK